MFRFHRSGVRRRSIPCGAIALLATLFISACTGEDSDLTNVRTVSGFAGVVAADEPRAALVGRDILGRNGTAADAAVAMGFAMTVTLPSRVGLGGGGACVVHDRADKRTDALLFLPQPSAEGGMVPGLARGLAALHARHGVRDWRLLVAPAEQLARFGHAVSRAFHGDLEAGRGRMTPDLRRRFLREDGTVPEIGERIRQEALSAVLSGLRQQGAGYLYTGSFARRLAAAASEAGEPMGASDLADYRARYAPTLTVPYGDHQLHLPPPPVLGGLANAQLWGTLRQGLGDNAEMSSRNAQALIEGWKRVLSERQAWLDKPAGSRPDPQDLVSAAYLKSRMATYRTGASTPAAQLAPPPSDLGAEDPTAGFAVADRFGNMVACSFTMNGLFGSGLEASGTGMLLAGRAAAEASGAALAPAVLSNEYTGSGYLAVSGTDGTAGQTALAELVRRFNVLGVGGVRGPDVDLARYLALPRIHHPGRPDQVRVEPEVPAAVVDGLRTSGHTLVKAPGLGRLQAVYCPRGGEDTPACQGAADPRGAGLAVRAQ